jgi:hypothetical protein
VDKAQIEKLIVDVRSEQEAVREKATQSLERLGALAVPALLGALGNEPSALQRRRLERLIRQSKALAPSSEDMRATRAVEVLERIGTHDARRHLESLAKGADGARLTREARAAIKRLSGQARVLP